MYLFSFLVLCVCVCVCLYVCVRTLIALFLRTVMIMTVISNLNSQRGHLSWTARLTFLVDMVRMLLVTLLLDMIQQGSLHMYRGFCSGMFQVCSLLTIKIIHLNELVILIWHRKKHMPKFLWECSRHLLKILQALVKKKYAWTKSFIT